MKAKIVFSAYKGPEEWGLYLMSIEGFNHITITKFIPKAGDPAVSPDGKMLAFVKVNLQEMRWSIFTLRIEKGEPIGQPRKIVTFRNKEIHYVDWLGTNQLVFTVIYSTPGSEDEKTREIWIVRSDGSGLRKLTQGGQPTGAPDGRHIAYLKKDREGHWAIWILDVKTGEERFLTEGREPDWCPCGDKIVFVTSVLPSQLMTVSINGTGFYWLTHPSVKDRFPAWSRNGEWVVFATMRWGTGYDLAIVNVKTKTIWRLTDWPKDEDVACFLYP